MSALLGRMPSAVGYQPTLGTEMGELQERITSTKSGSVTSIQAIYVPADDYTDPAPATAFTHLDSTSTSSARSPRRASIPRRPARLFQPHRRPEFLGEKHYQVARKRAADSAALQGPAGHHRDSRRRRTVRRGQAHRPPRSQDRALSCRSPSSPRSSSPVSPASTSSSRTPSDPSTSSATASGITCPTTPSCMSARSKTRRSERRRPLRPPGDRWPTARHSSSRW